MVDRHQLRQILRNIGANIPVCRLHQRWIRFLQVPNKIRKADQMPWVTRIRAPNADFLVIKIIRIEWHCLTPDDDRLCFRIDVLKRLLPRPFLVLDLPELRAFDQLDVGGIGDIVPLGIVMNGIVDAIAEIIQLDIGIHPPVLITILFKYNRPARGIGIQVDSAAARDTVAMLQIEEEVILDVLGPAGRKVVTRDALIAEIELAKDFFFCKGMIDWVGPQEAGA